MYECWHWCLIIVLHQLNKKQLFLNDVLDSFVSVLKKLMNLSSEFLGVILEWANIRWNTIQLFVLLAFCHTVFPQQCASVSYQQENTFFINKWIFFMSLNCVIHLFRNKKVHIFKEEHTVYCRRLWSHRIKGVHKIWKLWDKRYNHSTSRPNSLLELQQKLHRIEKMGVSVMFIWVPAHIGIKVNSFAD